MNEAYVFSYGSTFWIRLRRTSMGPKNVVSDFVISFFSAELRQTDVRGTTFMCEGFVQVVAFLFTTVVSQIFLRHVCHGASLNTVRGPADRKHEVPNVFTPPHPKAHHSTHSKHQRGIINIKKREGLWKRRLAVWLARPNLFCFDISFC